MTSLGYSMVAGGIGDILSSIVSLATGVPINMDDYLKAKGVSLAISIAAAGITYLASDLLSINIPDFAKDSMSEFIMKEFAFQAALMGVGTLLQNAGKQVFNHNDGQIKDEIREK